MSRRILIIQGHPHAADDHWCHGLAAAYAQGAQGAGHELREVRVATLDFPVLRSAHDWETHPAPAGLRAAQESIVWADHVVIFFPLWLGDMPALLKAFLEQAPRPGFAFTYRPRGFPVMHLKGKSARVIVTMGMPALVYRWFYRAHGVKALKRNILGFVGYRPVRDTIVGGLGSRSPDSIKAALADARALGRQAA